MSWQLLGAAGACDSFGRREEAEGLNESSSYDSYIYITHIALVKLWLRGFDVPWEVRLHDQEVTFDLFRAAGGKLVCELDPERRWALTSADGWELGQPGPGPNWRPRRGVQLKLEERCF